MFDETFRPVVAEIEARLIGIVRSAFERAGRPVPGDVETCYAMIDGAFRYCLQGQIGPAPLTRAQAKASFRSLLVALI